LGPPAGPELPAGSPLDAAQAALGVMPKQITLPLPPWLGPLAVCCALGIVPWVVYLAVTLPGRQRAVDYDIAWVGYDAVMGGDGGASPAAHCDARRLPARSPRLPRRCS